MTTENSLLAILRRRAADEIKRFEGYPELSKEPPVSEQPADYVVGGRPGRRHFGFDTALNALKTGNRVARSGWNGKSMFLFYVPGSIFTVNRPPLLGIYPEGTVIRYQSHIDMRTADGTIVPWLASQSDLLATDWHLV